MSRVLVLSPHPDDETLGCGGALLRHAAEGDELHWVIATEMAKAPGYSAERIAAREAEITAVAAAYPFAAVHRLGFAPAGLDTVPAGQLIGALSEVVARVQPEVVYCPFPGDVHTDHRAVFEAAAACTKTFRYPSVRTVLAYETPSETDFAVDPTQAPFRPVLFVDVTPYAERKIAIMGLFAGELGEPPFPRSVPGMRALMTLRGGQAGCLAAEAFVVIKDVRRL